MILHKPTPMASAIFPSSSLHSSDLRFSHNAFGNMSEFPGLDSQLSEEASDDDDTNNDADYAPAARDRPRRTRLFSKKYAPQAVADWYMIALDKKTALKKSTVKEDALGHLLATGWDIYYTQKKTKHELRYKAPNGKIYISLRTACKACIDQGTAAAMPPLPPPAAVSAHPQTEKKDSPPHPNPPLGEGKEPTPSLKELSNADNSERVELPVPLERNWGNKKTLARAAERGTPRRNPRTVLAYLMEQGAVSPGDRVYYNIAGKDNPLVAWGLVTNEGVIKCDCCSNAFSISNFEAHTGSTKRRPAANIFLEDGRSLLDCQKQLNQSPKETKPTEKVNNDFKPHSETLCLDKNDCICHLCHFGGELILCDLCPAAFHGSCLGFKGIPIGDWFCPSCCCKICGQVPYDFDVVSSSDVSFVKCVQCEQNVHIGCVRSVRVLEGGSYHTIDRENWFCTKRCHDVHMGLQNLLWKQIPLGEEENNLTFTMMKYCANAMSENHRRKLNIALGVLHESFRPVKDPITKNDLIEDVLFSRRSESKRLNFEGFYTVVLERKNTVTTVATVRVYGDEVAEVPFVATRLKYRRHGSCRALMNELEKQLMKMGVKKLTLPAVPEILNTWTGRFGFSKMTDSDRLELVKYIFLGFQHTVRCQKDLQTKRIPNNLEWEPRKRLKQTVLEDDISDAMVLDDWSSFSHAFD